MGNDVDGLGNGEDDDAEDDIDAPGNDHADVHDVFNDGVDVGVGALAGDDMDNDGVGDHAVVVGELGDEHVDYDANAYDVDDDVDDLGDHQNDHADVGDDVNDYVDDLGSYDDDDELTNAAGDLRDSVHDIGGARADDAHVYDSDNGIGDDHVHGSDVADVDTLGSDHVGNGNVDGYVDDLGEDPVDADHGVNGHGNDNGVDDDIGDDVGPWRLSCC